MNNLPKTSPVLIPAKQGLLDMYLEVLAAKLKDESGKCAEHI